MAKAELTEKKQMPRGVKRGGAVFPHISLSKAVEYSKKLVAKTHTGPQPFATIAAGVFGATGSRGSVRASALKQYGLLKGATAAYEASEMAKDIDAAPPAEKEPLLQRSFLLPKIFREIYETFHGDTVSRAKLEQRARALEVHPESAAECVQLFCESAVTCGIGRDEGENLVLASKAAVISSPKTSEDESTEEVEDNVEENLEEDSEDESSETEQRPIEEGTQLPKRPAKAIVSLKIDVDSSSDPDKLAKQLKLLRSYGLL